MRMLIFISFILSSCSVPIEGYENPAIAIEKTEKPCKNVQIINLIKKEVRVFYCGFDLVDYDRIPDSVNYRVEENKIVKNLLIVNSSGSIPIKFSNLVWNESGVEIAKQKINSPIAVLTKNGELINGVFIRTFD